MPPPDRVLIWSSVIHSTIHLALCHKPWPVKPAEGPASNSSWRWHNWVSVEWFTKRNSISSLAGIGEARSVKILLQAISHPLPLAKVTLFYQGSYKPKARMRPRSRFCRKMSFLSREYECPYPQCQRGTVFKTELHAFSPSRTGVSEPLSIKSVGGGRD